MAADQSLPALAALLGLVAGCGGDRDAPGPAPAAHEASLAVTRAGREVVAEVDGEPVFADCVARQMTELGVSRAKGLEQCIDFELLAQEARRRGYLDRPEVAATQRREMVRTFLDRRFYAEFDTPDDIPEPDLRRIWDQGLKYYFNHDEDRSMQFCRAKADDPKLPETPERAARARAARALAEDIYARLRGRTHVGADEFRAACEAASRAHPDAELSWSKGTFKRRAAVPEFADPLFAIPEVGMVSPPARTKWGFDVILLTHVLPARRASFAEAVPEIRDMLFNGKSYEGFRLKFFERWLGRLMQKHHIERFDDNLPGDAAVGRPG